MNQSLRKTALIFEKLMSEKVPVGVNEFSRTLGMPKSTVSRFLATMESLGFVRREKESRKFYLGLLLLFLAGISLQLRWIHRQPAAPTDTPSPAA